MAWSAVHNTVALAALLIFAANIFWSTAYDTIYALQDIDDDKRAGVKSTAILFGDHVFIVVALLYAAFGVLLALAGWLLKMGPVYFVTLAVSIAAFLWTLGRVKADPGRDQAFRAFLANAAIGGVILAGIIIDMNL